MSDVASEHEASGTNLSVTSMEEAKGGKALRSGRSGDESW